MAAIKSLDDSGTAQTVQPHGWRGRIIGWFMALLNRKLNRLAVAQLKLKAADRVLEIGCGAGQALRLVLTKTPCRNAAGIDLSPEMIQESEQANRIQLQAGQLELRQGKVESMPWPAQDFTHAFAISNFHIWDSRLAGLHEIFRVLKPSGKFVLCLRRARAKPGWFDQPGVTDQELAEDLKLLRHVGFQEIQEVQIQHRQPILMLIAMKPHDLDNSE